MLFRESLTYKTRLRLGISLLYLNPNFTIYMKIEVRCRRVNVAKNKNKQCITKT